MGILSKQAIEKRLQSGNITITPVPDEEDFDSDSVDVHLGDKVYAWRKPPAGSSIGVALWKSPPDDFSYTTFANEFLVDVTPDHGGIITLRPQTFYLAGLRQHTKLPPDIAMHVQGKSSLARLGVLIHLTAPHAHAGWEGRLTLEMYNLGPFNIELKPGMKIGQLTFWKVEDPSGRDEIPVRQFDRQETARGSSS